MVDPIVTKNWRDLIKPRGLSVDQESLSNTYGKFVAEPLERGFGITLGNSLRRVLLSRLQGAAITSVKIEGVEHEFMTIPEVAEDVTDIILNLKEVLLQIHTNEVKTIRIEADGPREIKAGDIIADGQVEVLNPGHHVLTISEGGRVRMEMTARRGRGYVPAEKNKVAGPADRHHPDRRALQPDPEGELPGHQRPRRAADRLRQADPRGLDRRLGRAGRRGRVRRQDREGAALDLHQLRRGRGARRGGEAGRGAEAEREPLPVGRRARALGPQRQLPAERQHQDASATSCRRPRPRC